MTISSRYTNEQIEGLIQRFQAEAAPYLAPSYCRTRRTEFLLQRMLLPEVFDGRYDLALDIGCGVGFKSLLLGELAEMVHGIDISTPYHGFASSEPATVVGQAVLERIGCRWATLTPVVDFGAFLGERKERYDLIVSDYLVEHIAEPGSLHAAIFCALRPGGTVVHTIPNSHEALDQFVRLNLRTSLRELLKGFAGVLRPGRRAQKITLSGILAPIPHSEFLTDYRRQFDVYRLEHNVFPMIEAGFEISRIVPTREHAYTVVGRRPDLASGL